MFFRHTVCESSQFLAVQTGQIVFFLHGLVLACWLGQSIGQFLDKITRTGGRVSGILEASDQSGAHDRRIGMLGHGLHLAG